MASPSVTSLVGTVAAIGPASGPPPWATGSWRLGRRSVVRGCATRDPIPCRRAEFLAPGCWPAARPTCRGRAGGRLPVAAVPEAIDTEEALLLTDNLGTGWIGAQRADIPPGGTVVVFGLGAVGSAPLRVRLALRAGQVLRRRSRDGRRLGRRPAGATPLEDQPRSPPCWRPPGAGVPAPSSTPSHRSTMTEALVRSAGGTVSVIGVHDPARSRSRRSDALFRSVTLRMTTHRCIGPGRN